jgi:hypothetical protein
MKIFLCWSGERSKQFAAAASQFLTALFGAAITPEISTDIEKGAVWFEDLANALRQARVGVLCLTPEAVGSPWIHFEAGILAKVLQDQVDPAAPAAGLPGPAIPAVRPIRRAAALRIFPFLHGVEAATLKGPLTAYQSTLTKDRDDVWRLVETIQSILNEESGAPTPTDVDRKAFQTRFEEAWTALSAELKAIKPAKLSVVVPDFETLFQRKTFDESMYDCLDQGWLGRYDGARSVETRLRAVQKTVREACERYVADMFDAVITDVSAYAMCLAVQLAEPKAPIDPAGRVAFPHVGLATACERLRKQIKERVARLVDERQAPYFPEAFQFEVAEALSEKKRAILRRLADIRQRKTAFSEEMNAHVVKDDDASPLRKHYCRDSDWDLERIVYYLWVEETWTNPYLATHLRSARTELEREAGGASDPFRLPLTYALRVVAKGLPCVKDAAIQDEARALHDRIVQGLPVGTTDGFGDLRQALGDLRAKLDAVASSVADPNV